MPANPSLVPAPAGKRLGAKLIDVVPVVALAIMCWNLAAPSGADAAEGESTDLLILSGIGFLAYSVWLWGWEAIRGNTVGNAVLGLRTSNLEGRPAGWTAVFLRGLIIFLGFLALVVGAVAVLVSNLWDRNDRRQGWHDKAARTYVFDIRAGRNPLETGGIAGAEPAHITQQLDDGVAAPEEVSAVSKEQAPAPIAVVPGAGVPGIRPAEPVPAHPDDEYEATRLSSRSRSGGMRNDGSRGGGIRIRFDDGRDVALAAEALIGRDPAARMGESIEQLIDFPDQTKSVSKTHLHLRLDGTTVWVTDRNSTNGSAVISPDGQRSRLAAEEQVRAVPGSTVHFGDRSFSVENA